MANQYAVNHKKRHVTKPAKLTDVATQGGRVRVLHDTFVTAATADQTEILFGKLPPGAKVWEFAMRISGTLGTNSALQAGYTGATTAFLGSAASTSAATRYMMGAASAATLAPVSKTSEVDVVVKYDPSSGTTAATNGVTITVWALYTLD